jgi:hypothetical protein
MRQRARKRAWSARRRMQCMWRLPATQHAWQVPRVLCAHAACGACMQLRRARLLSTPSPAAAATPACTSCCRVLSCQAQATTGVATQPPVMVKSPPTHTHTHAPGCSPPSTPRTPVSAAATACSAPASSAASAVAVASSTRVRAATHGCEHCWAACNRCVDACTAATVCMRCVWQQCVWQASPSRWRSLSALCASRAVCSALRSSSWPEAACRLLA